MIYLVCYNLSMGKKRERRLQAEIDALTTRVLRFEESARQARQDAEQNLAAAHREMREDWFAIITKSGRVVRGKAVVTSASSAPIRVENASGWVQFAPGPRELSAQIIIESIK